MPQLEQLTQPEEQHQLSFDHRCALAKRGLELILLDTAQYASEEIARTVADPDDEKSVLKLAARIANPPVPGTVYHGWTGQDDLHSPDEMIGFAKTGPWLSGDAAPFGRGPQMHAAIMHRVNPVSHRGLHVFAHEVVEGDLNVLRLKTEMFDSIIKYERQLGTKVLHGVVLDDPAKHLQDTSLILAFIDQGSRWRGVDKASVTLGDFTAQHGHFVARDISKVSKLDLEIPPDFV